MDNIIYVDFKNKVRLKAPPTEEVPGPPAPVFIDRKAAFLELMDSGMVRTVIDGLNPAVLLPPEHKVPVVNLNWSWKFSIPDLEIDERGIRGTLSFQQVPFKVDIPWQTIVSMWNLNNPEESRIDWNSNAQ